MKYIDHHAHMVSRTTDDYQQMALTGCVAVTEPAFWAGWDRSARRRLRGLLPPAHRLRAARAPRSTGIQHYTWMAMNPKEADDRELSREVLERIPKFLDRPTVLGIGEIGLNRVTRNEIATYTEQVELALAHQQLILIHTPHLEDKLKGTRISVDVLQQLPDASSRERVMVDHAEEHTLEMILDHGYWAGLTLYPQTKVSAAARRRHDRAVRPGADLRRRRLRLGPERPDRRAALRHGDAPPPAPRGADPARRVREPGAVPRASRRKFKCCRPERRTRQPTSPKRAVGLDPGIAVSPCNSIVHTGSFHLTYCTNIHPADGWDGGRRQPQAVRAGAQGAVRRRRRRSASGCGCRRASARAARRATACDEFRAFLDAEGLYVALINGFPVRAVPRHAGQGRASTRPTGATTARVDYTLDLIRILRALLPRGPRRRRLDRAALLQALDGRRPAPTRWETMTRQRRARRRSARRGIRREHGAFIHLDIEPEPDCLLENTDETIDFFEQWLLPVGAPLLAARARHRRGRGARRAARARPGLLRLLPLRGRVRGPGGGARAPPRRRHPDRPRAAQLGARRHGSGAMPRRRRGRRDRLRPFADTTYLHQVVERRGTRAAPLSRSRRGARCARRRSRRREWRIHFHVPLFTAEYDALGSTQDYVARGARHALAHRRHDATSRSRPTPGTCCRPA